MQTPPISALAAAALLAAGLALPASSQSRQSPEPDIAPRLQQAFPFEPPFQRSVSVPGSGCDGAYVHDWWKLVQPQAYGPALGGLGLVLQWPLLPQQAMAGELLVGPSSPGSLGLVLVGERTSPTPLGFMLANVSQVVLVRFDATGYARVPVSFESLPCLMGTGYHFSVQAMLPSSTGQVLSQGLEITIL